MMCLNIITSAWSRPLVVLLVKLMRNKHLLKRSRSPGGIVFISSQICVKSTAWTTLAEARAMEYVAQNTSIPVPKIYAAFEHKGRVYIVMQRINGTMLGHGWYLRSDDSKQRLLRQLKGMIEELRNIPPPHAVGVANIDGGPIFDVRLPKKFHWGPFSSIDEFHKELLDGNDLTNVQDGAFPGLNDLGSFYNQPWPKSVFTHGDLSSLNILSRGDDIVGIVDWETAGWLPPYWEYVTAWNVNPQNSFWQEEVDKFLTPLPHAREMDTIRRKYFGFF